jgi:hypothetical protein
MLNFEYPEAVMVETGSLKLFQNRLAPVQGKCCLKNAENFDLTLFWYSPIKTFRRLKIFVISLFFGRQRHQEMPT